MSQNLQTKHGYTFAILAFVMWGLAPIYFKAIDDINALEILTHRVIWSVIFVLVIVTLLRQWHKFVHIIKQPKLMLVLCVSALLLGFNWGLFIWAINNNHILDASLGYYINPLLNVLLGVLFLSEKLRKWQMFAVALAMIGVAIQLISFGSFPIIAFSLASSFAIYGLIRKKIPVESLTGLLLESLILIPIAIIYWYTAVPTSTSNMMNNTQATNLLLICAGVVTTLPLLCFTAAAKRLPYSTLGFFQYIGPSLMFVLAVFLYDEPITYERLVTFVFIWTALITFSMDSINQRKNK